MRLPILISLCLLLAAASLSAKSVEFSESRSLPPLKLSAADLDKILHETQASIASANGSPRDKESARESVTLGVRGHEIRIPHFSLASSVAFPKELFKFTYNYNRPGKPISSVIIDLDDNSRHMSVRGEAEDKVKATSNLIEEELVRFSTTIGGVSFRHVAGLCLTVVFLASLGIGGAWWWRTRTYNALVMLSCSILGLLLVRLLPWPRYLPGFALYQSYSPFILIRYAPQIFFLLVVAALLGIPLSYLLSRSRPRS